MSRPNPDWSALRADFPILDQKIHGKPLIYFDNAATSEARSLFVQAACSKAATALG